MEVVIEVSSKSVNQENDYSQFLAKYLKMIAFNTFFEMSLLLFDQLNGTPIIL